MALWPVLLLVALWAHVVVDVVVVVVLVVGRGVVVEPLIVGNVPDDGILPPAIHEAPVI